MTCHYANDICTFANSFGHREKWIKGKATKIVKRLVYCSGNRRKGTGLGNVKVEPKHFMAECKTYERKK